MTAVAGCIGGAVIDRLTASRKVEPRLASLVAFALDGWSIDLHQSPRRNRRLHCLAGHYSGPTPCQRRALEAVVINRTILMPGVVMAVSLSACTTADNTLRQTQTQQSPCGLRRPQTLRLQSASAVT